MRVQKPYSQTFPAGGPLPPCAGQFRTCPAKAPRFRRVPTAGHKAIVRLFGRFDMMRHERVQASVYRWFFDTVSTLPSVTVDMDSSVITRHGEQQGAARGYTPNKRGRPSHHPLLAFVSEARMVANFWLRPGDGHQPEFADHGNMAQLPGARGL